MEHTSTADIEHNLDVVDDESLSPEPEANLAHAVKLVTQKFADGFLIGQIQAALPHESATRLGGVVRYMLDVGDLVCIGKATAQEKAKGEGKFRYKHVNCLTSTDCTYERLKSGADRERKEMKKRMEEAKNWPQPALECRTEIERVWGAMLGGMCTDDQRFAHAHH